MWVSVVRPDRWNEAQFLPGSSCIDTAIWMHYMDANQTAGEETWRQLHKNVESNTEQVLATTPHETKTIQVRWARHAGHCWRSKDELVSDVLLWTPTYDQAKAGRPARTYIQQLCEDTGCNPEDRPEVMNDREKWREMVKDIRVGGTSWWWWWWWYIYIACIYFFHRCSSSNYQAIFSFLPVSVFLLCWFLSMKFPAT